MTNEIQNFWLNQAELRKKMIREEKKKQSIPDIYKENQGKASSLKINNYQI